MYFVSFIVILSILFAYADDKKIIRNGFTISFWILTISMSLRYGYGNDYFSYMRHFNNIVSYPSFLMAYQQSGLEIGWVLMSRLLSPFGFQSQIFLCSIILYSIFYYLIKKYVPRSYRWLSLMIFLLNSNLFLLNLSMLRQGIACAFFFWSVILILEDKRIKSILVCLLGISMHTSALIGIPFVLLVYFRSFIKPKFMLLGSVVFCVCLYFNKGLSEYLFSFLLGSDELKEVYGKYMSNTADNFKLGIGVLIQYVSIVPALIYFKYFSETDKYFVIFYLMVLVLIPLSANAIMLLRLISYFLPFAVILFPRLCDRNLVSFVIPLPSNLRNRWRVISKASLFLYLVYVTYSYIHFFSSETYSNFYKKFEFFFDGYNV